MRTYLSALTVMAVALSLSSVASAKSKGGGPPPEAFAACEAKDIGDSCTVDTPHGDVDGTCKEARHDDRMLCVPEGGRPDHKK